MTKIFDHMFIVLTILCTVCSQLIMRWQVNLAGPMPNKINEKFTYIIFLLIKPWIATSILLTFFAGISWLLVMTKFEISYAYPFISLNFILVMFAGLLLFNEVPSLSKIIGGFLVIIGIFILARG